MGYHRIGNPRDPAARRLRDTGLPPPPRSRVRSPRRFLSHPNVERSELVLSGAASPLARERFEALGIAVTERAFEQLEGESARLSEPPP